MINRTTLTQRVSTSIEAGSRPATLVNERWRAIAEEVALPETRRGYLLFVLSLLVLAGAMAIHIMLSADIMRLQVQLTELQGQQARIERQNANLLWEASRNMTLQELHASAVETGYQPIAERVYVIQPALLARGATGAGQTPASIDGAQQDDSQNGWLAEKWQSLSRAPADWGAWLRTFLDAGP